MNIEDEALSVIKMYAEERDVSLGQAVSDLVFRGAETLPHFKMKNGWVVFEPSGTRPITLETLEQSELADQEDEYQRALSPRR